MKAGRCSQKLGRWLRRFATRVVHCMTCLGPLGQDMGVSRSDEWSRVGEVVK